MLGGGELANTRDKISGNPWEGIRVALEKFEEDLEEFPSWGFEFSLIQGEGDAVKAKNVHLRYVKYWR